MNPSKNLQTFVKVHINVFCGEVKVTKKYISSLYFGSLLLCIDLDKIQ
jgi:hypothetical protein